MLDITSTDPLLIETERFNQYMDEMLMSYVGSVLTGLPIYVFIFQPLLQDDFQIYAWLLLDILLAVSVGVTYVAFYRLKSVFALSFWKKASLVPLVIFSLVLCCAPWLILKEEADIYLYTMIIMIIALTGTIAHSISFYLERQIMFMLLPLLSLVVKILTMEHVSQAVYWLLGFLWISSFLFSFRVHKMLIQAIMLKYENIQARLEAERSSNEKSRFFAVASHDIRQPFQAINLFVSALEARGLEEKDTVILQSLQKSVSSVSELLDGLFNISKLDAHGFLSQAKHCFLSEILERQANQARILAGNRLEVFVDIVADCVVYVDTVLLEQVISNLVANAVRYTEKGKVVLRANIDGEKVLISVEDSGRGIKACNQEIIFDDFLQLDDGKPFASRGLGLGLSIAKKICQKQEWSLRVASVYGQGSTFSLAVPCGKAEEVYSPKALDKFSNMQTQRVVVIEGDDDTRLGLYNVFSSWGCHVLAFESAELAFALVDDMPVFIPDVVISDYWLNDGLTGVQAIEKLKALYGSGFVSIVLSAEMSEVIKATVKNSGITLLYKPLTPAKLRVAVQKQLKKQSS